MSIYDGLIGNQGLNLNSTLNPIFLPQTTITEVDGLKDVMAIPMGPNSSMLALDKNKPILWVIRTDQNRSKVDTLQFDLSPHVPEPDPTVKGLEDRVGSIESRFDSVDESLKKVTEMMKKFEEMMK